MFLQLKTKCWLSGLIISVKKTILKYVIWTMVLSGIMFLKPVIIYSQNENLKLLKPRSEHVFNFSGDEQHQTVNERTEKPLRVKLVNQDSKPVANTRVYFDLLTSPKGSTHFKIIFPVCKTNTNGIAQTYVHLGTKEGEYQIKAVIRGDYTQNIQVFKVFARKSNWIFMLVIGVIGGLGLFLFGMKILSEGMQRAAGENMRTILGKLTYNRFIAVGVGAFVAMTIQSSSATTVMLVSFVQSGLMQFAQTLGIILGADIGTTITAQIIAFKLTEYSLLMIGLGFVLYFFPKNNILKNIGESVMGFGILFFGMNVMSDAMSPLQSDENFIGILLKLEKPLMGILIGTLFTALIQSSSAFIGILIIFSTQGFLTLEAAIPLLLGANLGTSVTAILASINTNNEAKKVAVAHTLFKIFGVMVFVWWIPVFADFIYQISPGNPVGIETLSQTNIAIPRQIANAHTIFNVVLTLISIPFIGKFAKFINFIFPKKPAPEDKIKKLKYLDEKYIPTPALALSLAKQETILMGKLVQDMLTDILKPFLSKQTHVFKEISLKEERIDFLQQKINNYIILITRQNIGEKRIRESFQIIYTVKEFEQMADVISKTLFKKAREWSDSNLEFSNPGRKEIEYYHLLTLKQISRAIEVFRDVNLEKAKSMKRKYKKYRDLSMELERHHFERLRDEILKSVKSSKYHLEVISMLRIITSHATNIARILLKWSTRNN